MKKTKLVLLFVLLFIVLLITKVSAIDMNLINSIRQNEVNEAENLSTSTNVPDDNAVSNSLTNSAVQIPSSNVSTVTPDTASEEFGLGQILNILLIVVGVLIIFLGIAILIRMSH